MLVLWPDAAGCLRDLLGHDGLDPNRVDSPRAAWLVFERFLAVGVDVPGSPCGDRFGVSWGCPQWSERRPVLSFHRHVVAPDQQCRLSLVMVFPDEPRFAGVGELNAQESGSYDVVSGKALQEVVGEVLWEVAHCPPLQAMWAATPVWSTVAFGRGAPPIRPRSTPPRWPPTWRTAPPTANSRLASKASGCRRLWGATASKARGMPGLGQASV